ncbi:MAG: hypothetical protein KDD84_19960 [Caldilineaceae bacterium]|nr:hypothetical protein [Caldilineaceae bacterium]
MKPRHQLDLHDVDPMVARAQALAQGLRTYHPTEDLPPALWETAYLLQEGADIQRPVAERLRILGLMATTLDQFFAVDVPVWRAQANDDPVLAQRLQAMPLQIESITQRVSTMLRTDILPRLTDEAGIHICAPAELEDIAQQWVRRFFQLRVYPLLTPLAVDPGHPFPFISSFSLNLLVELHPEGYEAWEPANYARIKVPRLLPRFIHVPVGADQGAPGQTKRCFLQSEEMLRFFLPDLFPGLVVHGAYLFRVIRAAEPRPTKSNPLQRHSRQQELSLPVVRLDVEQSMPDAIFNWLVDHLNAPAFACYRMPDQIGELQLVELANILDGIDPGAAANPWSKLP